MQWDGTVRVKVICHLILNLNIRGDVPDALPDSQKLAVFTEELLPRWIWIVHIKGWGFVVHKSKSLNGLYDSSRQNPESDQNQTYVGWFDIRTGILHPVIWGSGPENIRPLLCSCKRKMDQISEWVARLTPQKLLVGLILHSSELFGVKYDLNSFDGT